MTITLNGTTGIDTPALNGNVDGLALKTAGVTRLNINNSGYVTTPTIPSFYARYATNKTKAGNVWSQMPNFDYTDFNVGGHWNGTNTFTAPVAGLYQFLAGGFFTTGATGDVRVGLAVRRNNVDVQIGGGQLCTPDSPFPINTYYIGASANDYFTLWAYSPISVVTGAGPNYSFIFAGHLIG